MILGKLESPELVEQNPRNMIYSKIVNMVKLRVMEEKVVVKREKKKLWCELRK